MSNNPSQSLPETPPRDPLESLHRMSRTAGLGSQDYVAVNPTAVAALLLGLLSASSVLGPFLLVIPAVTLVVGFVAIRQVRQSAGTQTGQGLAVLGVTLAIGFVALVGGREVVHAREVRNERGVILQLIEQLGSDLSQADYDAAWAKFAPRFKEGVSKEDFISLWSRLRANAYYGPIKAIRSNGIIDVQTGAKLAYGVVIIERQSGPPDRRRTPLTFRKVDGQWYIEEIPFDFTPPTVERAQ